MGKLYNINDIAKAYNTSKYEIELWAKKKYGEEIVMIPALDNNEIAKFLGVQPISMKPKKIKLRKKQNLLNLERFSFNRKWGKSRPK